MEALGAAHADCVELLKMGVRWRGARGARLRGMTTKERLHKLVDELSELEADDALRILIERREDPVIAAFRDAPEDDEPLTAEEEAALERSREEYRRGEGVPLDEIRHEFS